MANLFDKNSYDNAHLVIIRIYHECKDGIEKSVPRIPVGIMRLAECCQTVITREGIFLSHLHTNNEKGFQKILNTMRCDMHLTWLDYINIIMTSQIVVRLFVFIFTIGRYGVCEIEFSHMGKNSRNPDLVCEKDLYH